MLKLVVLTAVVLSFFGRTSIAEAKPSVSVACPGHVAGVKFYVNATWHWQDRLDRKRTASEFNPNKVKSCRYTLWVADRWRARARSNHLAYRHWKKEHLWLINSFMCIHRYEGAWNANTGNGYYGGLQMDRTFQSQYGSEYLARWGSADNWPAWAQRHAAIRAYESGRGFYPWPNTARVCGLI